MPGKLQDVLMLLGRIAIATIFIIAGFVKITHFPQIAAFLTSKGLPSGDILTMVSIAMEFGGGLLVLFGWKARFGALLLCLFIIPVSFIFHSFWTYSASSFAMQAQLHSFAKNLAILGGTLYIVAHGPGRISFDRFHLLKNNNRMSPLEL